MRPKDLRIGNYVQVRDMIARVDRILSASVDVTFGDGDRKNILIGNVKPIRLKSEHFTENGWEPYMFGFKRKTDRTAAKLIVDECGMLLEIDDGGNNVCLDDVRYVHEVQNAFALFTDVEFKIKMK